MAQSIFRSQGDERLLVPLIAANSEVFTDGTLVSVNSSGFLIVSTAGLRIYGVCRQNFTASSTNQTVALVRLTVADPLNLQLSMLGDQAMVAGDRFKWADVSTVSAGLQTVAVSTATTAGQLCLDTLQSDVDTNPGVAAFQLLCRVAELRVLAYAQA